MFVNIVQKWIRKILFVFDFLGRNFKLSKQCINCFLLFFKILFSYYQDFFHLDLFLFNSNSMFSEIVRIFPRFLCKEEICTFFPQFNMVSRYLAHIKVRKEFTCQIGYNRKESQV